MKRKIVEEHKAKLAEALGSPQKTSFKTNPEENLMLNLPLHQIEVEPQLRLEIKEQDLRDITASFDQVGILQPVLVRETDDIFKKWKLISGERRYKAAKLMGKATIPAVIIQKDVNEYLVQLYENIHRKNLHSVEKARGVKAYVLAELATREDILVDEDVETIIRKTLGKLRFKRVLTPTEQAMAEILSRIKMSVNGLREWFDVTVFSDAVQRYILENNIPRQTIKQMMPSAHLSDEEIVTKFGELMETENEDDKQLKAKRVLSVTKQIQKRLSELSNQVNHSDFSRSRYKKQIKEEWQRIKTMVEMVEDLIEKVSVRS